MKTLESVLQLEILCQKPVAVHTAVPRKRCGGGLGFLLFRSLSIRPVSLSFVLFPNFLIDSFDHCDSRVPQTKVLYVLVHLHNSLFFLLLSWVFTPEFFFFYPSLDP